MLHGCPAPIVNLLPFPYPNHTHTDEMQRIADLGGRVIFWGRWRVEGILAVSRAIGDRHLKPYVTPEPEVCEWALTDRDCFLVLATDGIWCVAAWPVYCVV